MREEVTNLLPLERQRTLSRDYFLRLAVVMVLIMSTLALVAIVLLIPTYVFLTSSASTKEAHLASIDSTLSSSDEVSFSARLTTLGRNVATLSALAPSPSSIIRKALAVSHPDIALTGFVYAPAEGARPGTLDISGSAATRNALRNYQLALQSVSFARSAELPVSAYAEDSNIAFTIRVTLAP
jgi:Tfp pilus assembly protein PilN